MSKQQTAVEWLVEQLKTKYDINIERLSVTDKAKEMEKQQMINFHVSVMKKGLIEEDDRKWSEGYLPKITEVAEQCYNETFSK
jgi:hypothetical protein